MNRITIRPYSQPSWRSSMAPGTWSLVGSNMISDLDPKNNASLNPNYPASPEWHGSNGQSSVVLHWCGACWDESKGRLWLPLGGGHGGYAGNEAYHCRLRDDSPTWVMPRPPSGSIGNLLTTNDSLETTGVYADDRPRAIHSYNKHVYVPGIGPVLTFQGNCAWSATGTNFTWLLDETTCEWTLKTTSHPTVGSSSGMAACYDSTRHCIWSFPVSNEAPCQLDLSTWTWTRKSWSGHSTWGYRRAVYVPSMDRVVLINPDITGGFAVRNLDTGAFGTPGTRGTQPSGLLFDGQCGADWSEEHNALLIWHHSSNTTRISTLTPGANPDSDPWTWGELIPDSANSVTPTTKVPDGTYGRFGYSQRLGGCYLLNAVGQKVYFFATR